MNDDQRKALIEYTGMGVGLQRRHVNPPDARQRDTSAFHSTIGVYDCAQLSANLFVLDSAFAKVARRVGWIKNSVSRDRVRRPRETARKLAGYSSSLRHESLAYVVHFCPRSVGIGKSKKGGIIRRLPMPR